MLRAVAARGFHNANPTRMAQLKKHARRREITGVVKYVVLQLLTNLGAFSFVLVCPDWDAVSDRLLHICCCCDASCDGFGGTGENEYHDDVL